MEPREKIEILENYKENGWSKFDKNKMDYRNSISIFIEMA